MENKTDSGSDFIDSFKSCGMVASFKTATKMDVHGHL